MNNGTIPPSTYVAKRCTSVQMSPHSTIPKSIQVYIMRRSNNPPAGPFPFALCNAHITLIVRQNVRLHCSRIAREMEPRPLCYTKSLAAHHRTSISHKDCLQSGLLQDYHLQQSPPTRNLVLHSQAVSGGPDGICWWPAEHQLLFESALGRPAVHHPHAQLSQSPGTAIPRN